MKIAAFVDRIGPYHRARFAALGSCVDLNVFEYFQEDSVYLWAKQPEAAEYRRVCLIPGGSVTDCRFRTVASLVRNVFAIARYDAVMIPGWATARSLATLMEANIAALPAILMSESAQVDKARNPAVETLKSIIIRGYSAAFVGGEAHINYLSKLGMPRSKVCVGYDAVDNAHFQQLVDPVPSLLQAIAKPYFFCCARFVPQKNLVRLISAYRLYLDEVGLSSHLLVLAGSGREGNELTEMVRVLGLQQWVIFVGFVDYHELPAFYQRAEWFVLPSTSEPWGLVVNEALASGLPALVSERCGCVNELVREGLTGWTFDPFRVEEIADSLIRAHNSGDRRQAMREQALLTVRSFGPDGFARGALDAIDIAIRNGAITAGAFRKCLLRLVTIQ